MIGSLSNSSMLPIIVRIITFALGSVLNKGVSIVRNATANKLKDGDVMDENWRDAIVEDLDDIKSKIDGFSRKDLLASHCFLKEGIDVLTVALEETKDEQTRKVETNGLENIGESTTAATTTTMATATTGKENDSVDLNETIALSNAIRELQNASNDRLVSARECFKAAREEATRAFCNEALKIPDRIMAAKIRVVSKILECLQDTKAAASGCMLFLKELHYLPAIAETFSTYFENVSSSSSSSYLKSKFYKDTRLQNVKSVLSLNFAVSEFVAKFSSDLPNVRNWPRIHLSTRSETIHPLLLEIDVVQQVFHDEKFQPPENHVTSEKAIWRCCINSKGELLALLGSEDHHAFTLKRSGELKSFCYLRQATTNLGNYEQSQKIVALAIDRYDDLYVIVHFSSQGSTGDMETYVLFVFDSSFNEKCEHVLNFIEDESGCATMMVNNDGDVIIHFPDKHYLYVCDSVGNLKSRLSLEHHSTFVIGEDKISLQCVTDQNEIIMARRKVSTSGNYVLVYTKEGALKRTISLKYRVKAVTYNYATSKLEILGRKEPNFGTNPSYYILSYSENDDVEHLYLPATRRLKTIVSHPAGPAAFVFETRWLTGKTRTMFM